MYNHFQPMGVGMGAPAWIHIYGPEILLLIIWTIFWKGLALWHSAERRQHRWFIVLLILNTAGILDIIYLFGILKLKGKDLFKK